MSLTTFLAQLESSETQWGIYVNPRNLNDYEIGTTCQKKGNLVEEKAYIGSFCDFAASRTEFCGESQDESLISLWAESEVEHLADYFFNGDWEREQQQERLQLEAYQNLR